ncbi:MAG: (Fe-S)-binding protein [Dysgonomonas sp.]|nr:(Fe-S)-binding protein [Dysgonomonas sp.]
MRVGLFIPCYIDAIYPEVGIATLELLEKLGVDVGFPLEQTCCGQPMTNEGDFESSRQAEELFVNNFKDFDYVVGPAGSCVKQIRIHYDKLEQTDEVRHVREKTYELVEFLHDILKVESFPDIKFPYKVALHNSCSSIRGLNIARPSELMEKPFNKSADLLNMVEGLELVELSRPDECCGFGGTFCVTDEVVSTKMGCDKVADYVAHGAEYVVSPDMSCLMHQQGVAHKSGVTHIPFIHIAQVLNGGPFKVQES